MSWLWSSPPPEDPNPPQSSSSAEIAVDPYATSPNSDFGTAFGDDLVDQTSTRLPDSFDIYNTNSSPPNLPSDDSFSTSFDSPNSTSPSSPSLDFHTMRRINPTLVSPRAALRTPALNDPTVDYVFADDYKAFRKKSGTEQLTYLAGSAYLTGAIAGGSRGFYEAMRASAGKAPKLRLNAVLNGTGKRGSAMATGLGVLALAFSLAESAVYNYTSDETIGNYAVAGAIAGGLYKSTRGGRVAAIWALGGGAVALGTVYASRKGYYGRGLQGIL